MCGEHSRVPALSAGRTSLQPGGLPGTKKREEEQVHVWMEPHGLA
jgi:hypothetical protein